MKKDHLLLLFFCLWLITCKKDDEGMPEGRYGYTAYANISIIIDPNQERLDDNANVSIVPSGHGAQTPTFDKLKIVYVELMDDYTSMYANQHSYSIIPLEIDGSGGFFNGSFRHGGPNFTAKYLRLHFCYQNLKVACLINGNSETVNCLSFLSEYYNPNDSVFVGDNLIDSDSAFNQGQWYLEYNDLGTDTIIQGQTTALTEPNYLFSSKPNTSDQLCTIICPINPPLTFYKGNPRNFTISISSNNAFEWIEHSDPAYFEPLNGDTIYDFGLRGAKVIY